MDNIKKKQEENFLKSLEKLKEQSIQKKQDNNQDIIDKENILNNKNNDLDTIPLMKKNLVDPVKTISTSSNYLMVSNQILEKYDKKELEEMNWQKKFINFFSELYWQIIKFFV